MLREKMAETGGFYWTGNTESKNLSWTADVRTGQSISSNGLDHRSEVCEKLEHSMSESDYI